MLEKVQQTLKKAGIGNIIKGISTYHTTPPHNNKTYETLLRYSTTQNYGRAVESDLVSELLKPKSLLKCSNPMNMPHYL
jgi:hypothetical protein